ncbi:hypothetical protein E2C01_073214 [Portunus trituberculatus]|uniref:Uncharacterized protein n=1 Tax=Portunus trituberculatus TaxID=210409 RepID=A0A5B7IB34_PORTR|nr:hypothetical protein [Portunus trituberculatus]
MSCPSVSLKSSIVLPTMARFAKDQSAERHSNVLLIAVVYNPGDTHCEHVLVVPLLAGVRGSSRKCAGAEVRKSRG